MKVSRKGAAFIGHHEGTVLRWYADPTGTGTIGNGFTWASSAFRRWWEKNRPGQKFGPGSTMTRAESAEVLTLLLDEEYGAAVNRFFGKEVPQHVMDGTSSVVFNAGEATLRDRWATALKKGDVATAAELLKTTRTTSKGKRLQGLINRRLDEAELISIADYTIGRPRAAPVDAMADGVLRRRERGPAVEKLQRDLQALGFYLGQNFDEIFGTGTEAAVMEFQRSAGLKDDGIVGPKTFAALAAALEEKRGGVPPVDLPPAVERDPDYPLPDGTIPPASPPSGGSSGSRPGVMTRSEMYRAAQALLAALEAGEER